MVADLHAWAETRTPAGLWRVSREVFDDVGNYAIFAWLAGVRNYAAITPLSPPRGLPPDVSGAVAAHAHAWASEAHSHSWLTLAELDAADYEAAVNDRRRNGTTLPPAEGTRVSRREFLTPEYFEHLSILKTLGPPPDVRVVLWFDN